MSIGPNAHSILPPSNSARRKQCAASKYLQEQYPQAEDDPSAIEGRLAHEVIAAYARKTPIPPNATEEMLDGAEMWMDEIGRWLTTETCHIEEPVDIAAIHEECWGTPDLWFWRPTANTLHVYDYKFGHKYVDVFENTQLIEYAAGIIDTHPQMQKDDVKVILTIVQPRCYVDEPIRSWRLTVGELQPYIQEMQRVENNAMLNEAAIAHTGPECLDCSAAHACQTLQKVSYTCVQISEKVTAFDLPDDAIGSEKRIIDEAINILKARSGGLDAEILSRIKAGKNIRGWMTKQGQGREKWVRPIEEIVTMGQLMGIDVSKPGVLTPRQAVKAGLPDELVQGYTERPLGEIKLVQDDAKRARKVFNVKKEI